MDKNSSLDDKISKYINSFNIILVTKAGTLGFSNPG